MYVRVKDKQFLKKHNKIWKKIERLMSIDKLKYKPVYGHDNKYIKVKTKTFADSITTNFHQKKYLKKRYHAIGYQ